MKVSYTHVLTTFSNGTHVGAVSTAVGLLTALVKNSTRPIFSGLVIKSSRGFKSKTVLLNCAGIFFPARITPSIGNGNVQKMQHYKKTLQQTAPERRSVNLPHRAIQTQ